MGKTQNRTIVLFNTPTHSHKSRMAVISHSSGTHVCVAYHIWTECTVKSCKYRVIRKKKNLTRFKTQQHHCSFITLWQQHCFNKKAKQQDLFDIKTKMSKMLSTCSRGTLMSHTEQSVQCCFKSNTYCVLIGDAQLFFCGFIGNIFTYII